MSELPGNVAPARVPRPRESALGVVVRAGIAGGFEVLLGRRSRSSRFLPGHLAFPGGRVDPSDRPGEAGSHLRCAAREMSEETGLDIPESDWIDAGERVTPPLFPVRFRTEFFVAAVSGTTEPGEPPTDENESLGFERPGDVVRRWASGEEALAPPVLAVLRALDAADVPVEPAAVADVVRRANAEEERAPRIEFVPDIRVFPVRTRTLPPATHTNVWIPAGDRFVVVDPGSDDPREVGALLRVVGRLVADGPRPEAVVLTHHHQDHVSGAGPIARELGVPVAAHEAVLDRVGDRLDGAATRAVAPGSTIDLGGLSLHAILTEGHAPGHLAWLVPERRALISGDLVSALSTMLIDPDSGDMDAYLASLDRAAALDVRWLLPAHGPPVPRRALARVRDHRLDRERRIVEALADGLRDLPELAARAYADTPDAVAFLSERQTLAHLLRLERSGRARRTGSGWRPG